MAAAVGAVSVEHGFVDQVELGAEIVDDHQQREAGEPRGIGFPLEPGQLVRHAGRSDQILHHVIEAAAVHLPRVALDALGQAGAGLEAEIEMDEVERAADPGDAGNDVQPTDDEARPLGEHGSTTTIPSLTLICLDQAAAG